MPLQFLAEERETKREREREREQEIDANHFHYVSLWKSAMETNQSSLELLPAAAAATAQQQQQQQQQHPAADAADLGEAGPLALACFLALMTSTAAALTAAARFFHRHMEVAHPIYAVLLQECAGLAAAAWAAAACLAAAAAAGEPAAKMVANELIAVAGIVHQVSWLVVSSLRWEGQVGGSGGREGGVNGQVGGVAG